MLPKILKQYGLANATVHPYQIGYRNRSYPITTPTGQHLNLIVYKNEPGISQVIRNAHTVAKHLAGQGIAVRQTQDDRILQIKTSRSTRYAALYNYLPGRTIPWGSYTTERIKNLGGALGQMHQKLRTLKTDLPSIIDINLNLCDRMTQYFTDPQVAAALRQKLNLAISAPTIKRLKSINAAATTLKSQPLHMDFVRGNILFDGDQICGIIDFEKTANGPRIFDIARTLAFLLVDCKYKSESQITKYFLYSGYHKRGGGLAKSNILQELVNFYLIYDLYKFLRHNPYESLAANEHFIRTKNILINRGLIDVE